MKVSDEGIALIKKFEGLMLHPYLCAAGVWTIGYGHTGDDFDHDDPITEGKAVELLRKDLAVFETGVSRLIGSSPTNQHEFDAMTSLAFNIGLAAFRRSTVLREHVQGNRAKAAVAFEMWVKGGGRVLAGLVKRRKAERALYLRVS